MIISKKSKSMVYHRPECRYAQKIQTQNTRQVDSRKAAERGWRPCKCCDCATFFYKLEKDNIETFKERHNIDVDLKNDKIYVRTDVGCWKLVYVKKSQKFKLMHRNYVRGRISLDEVDAVQYHHQDDIPFSKSIMSHLEYIQKHDHFKQHKPTYLSQMPQSTEKQKQYYRAAKKREAKRSARRVDYLFLMLEKGKGMKQLSFC